MNSSVQWTSSSFPNIIHKKSKLIFSTNHQQDHHRHNNQECSTKVHLVEWASLSLPTTSRDSVLVSAVIYNRSLETPGLIYQDIFEKLWTDTKKNNFGLNTLKSLISEYDTSKQGVIFFSDFKFVIENRLKIKTLMNIDMRVLGKRYKSPT